MNAIASQAEAFYLRFERLPSCHAALVDDVYALRKVFAKHAGHEAGQRIIKAAESFMPAWWRDLYDDPVSRRLIWELVTAEARKIIQEQCDGTLDRKTA